MKMNLFWFLIFTALFLVGCSGPKNYGESDYSSVAAEDRYVSVRFYKGGFYTDSAKNWSHDITLDVNNLNNVQGTAVPENSACMKGGFVSRTDAELVIGRIRMLKLNYSDGPTMEDGGVEYVDVKTELGEVYRYYLTSAGAPQGELYAINGEELTELLKNLYTALPENCP
ncbi:MAG: hypothetical protein AB7H97_00165 [Pseudobdellovibrionaceae bacterium]